MDNNLPIPTGLARAQAILLVVDVETRLPRNKIQAGSVTFYDEDMAKDTLIKLEDGSEFYLSKIDHLEANKSTGKFRFVLKTGKSYETDRGTFYYFIEKYNLSVILKDVG